MRRGREPPQLHAYREPAGPAGSENYGKYLTASRDEDGLEGAQLQLSFVGALLCVSSAAVIFLLTKSFVMQNIISLS